MSDSSTRNGEVESSDEPASPSMLRRAFHLAGIDRAVGWTAAPRLWAGVAGPISVLLIGTRLTPEEQGYYYTFVSVLSLMAFFELGLASIIQQFASHEYAFLRWAGDARLDGTEVSKGRLAALTRQTMRWYGIVSLLLTITLLVAGFLFFAPVESGAVVWRGPWIVQSLLASASLLLAPTFALLEGCGRLAEVARIRTMQVIVSNLLGWTVLLAGGKLWVSAAIWAGSLLVGGIWVLRRWRPFFSDLLRCPVAPFSWSGEVWPLQWRTAATWASTFLSLQVITPILFRFDGPVAAGRMGMTIGVASAIGFLAMAWTKARLPIYGSKIARGDYAGLDALFFPDLWRAVAVMVSGGVVLLSIVMMLQIIEHPFAERLLPPLPLALLLLAFLAKLIVNAESAYFKAHKQEPLLVNRIVAAVLIVASTLFFVQRWGLLGIVGGYLAVTLIVMLGGSTWIFIRKRQEWHG
ncbi:MAG TPA: hypothetical protein VF701_06280 [Thermoanaerobaculia bacterium]